MAKTFDSTTVALLESGNVEFRYLASFELESGTYYFGNHTPGELLSWDGKSWYGLGGLAQVSELRTAAGLAADQCTITIDGTMLLDVPEGYESSSQWLRDILREDMINRRFELWELLIDPATGVETRAIKQFAGPVDSTPLDLKRPKLSIRVRSNRQAFGWPTGRTRSDADQQRVASGDRSLRHVSRLAARNGKLPVGYVPSSSGVRSSGGGSGSSRDGGAGGGGLQLF